MQTFPRFKEFEAQLRAAASCRWSNGRWNAPACWKETLPPRSPRAHPQRDRPLAPLLKPAMRDRLHHALSVVYGIEPYVILKDIWGMRDRDVERTALWMADALIDAALRESGQTPEARTARAKSSNGAAGTVRAARAPAAAKRRSKGEPS
ncbi:MAG: hypothetical protein WKG52_16485 [Variovorax sp.]